MTVRILDASEFEGIRATHVASNYVYDYCFMTRSRLMYATNKELESLGREDLATLAAMMEITKLRLMHALDNEQRTFNLQETREFYEKLHTTRTIVHMRGDCAHIYNIILHLKGIEVLAELDRVHLNELASYLFSMHEHLKQIEEVDDEEVDDEGVEDIINKVELPCHDGHKSFYGRAHIIFVKGKRYLKSYNTIVCSIDDNHHFICLWDGYSRTTLRHVNSFLKQLNYDYTINKARWEQMAYEHSLGVYAFPLAEFYMG